MTHDKLLEKIDYYFDTDNFHLHKNALRAVVELHKPSIRNNGDTCECDVYDEYMMGYPCDTIKTIEKELR
jgi:hypothetical protein